VSLRKFGKYFLDMNLGIVLPFGAIPQYSLPQQISTFMCMSYCSQELFNPGLTERGYKLSLDFEGKR
jgi:hypothetical protein